MPNLYRCENTNQPKELQNCENRKISNTQEQRKKLNFKTCKKNTFNSLCEVEHFLRNTREIGKYLKLYKILK